MSRYLAFLVLAGCGATAEDPPEVRGGGGGGGAQVAAGVGGAPGTGGIGGMGGIAGVGGAGGAVGPACPEDMARVGAFCMDRYEAPNQKGAKPMVMQSATGGDAWCKKIGKRLCTQDEWETACSGPKHYTYPYGNTHLSGACNDEKVWKVVNEQVLATWPSAAAQAEVQKLYQAAPSGSYGECVSADGVYDLTGNVEEWTVRTKPTSTGYPHVLKGCYWAACYGGSKPTCGWTNPAHADGFMFYETGFRCCRDLQP